MNEVREYNKKEPFNFSTPGIFENNNFQKVLLAKFSCNLAVTVMCFSLFPSTQHIYTTPLYYTQERYIN